MSVMDRHGLVHVVDDDAMAACGRSFQRDGLCLEAQDELGMRVDAAPTCLWCVNSRRLRFHRRLVKFMKYARM